MNSGGLKIDSVLAALLYACGGVAVGLVVSVFLLVAEAIGGLAVALPCVVLCAALGFLLWMVTIGEVYNRRRLRRQRIRDGQERSPWGERRSEPPRPYEDRLSSYLANEGCHIATHSSPPVRSRMRFWCLVDWACFEPTEPKPAWFIRRILTRIRHAVRGTQPAVGVPASRDGWQH